MNLLIFGPTSGTGRVLIEQALDQGHDVTMFVRNPDALTTKHPSLTFRIGNVSDYGSVEAAIRGKDAVLSASDTNAPDEDTTSAQGMKNIITAMEKLGVRRLISESSLGVGDSKGQLGFFYNLLLIPLLLHKVFADKEIQEKYIKNSTLDWVIVRPATRTNGPRTGAYRSGFGVTDKSIKRKVSHADVADFMLKQLTDDTYVRKTPGISYVRSGRFKTAIFPAAAPAAGSAPRGSPLRAGSWTTQTPT